MPNVRVYTIGVYFSYMLSCVSWISHSFSRTINIHKHTVLFANIIPNIP